MTVEKLVCLQLSLVGGSELAKPISSNSSVSSTAEGIRIPASSVEDKCNYVTSKILITAWLWGEPPGRTNYVTMELPRH